MCRVARRPPKRWSTASCSCRRRSVAAPTSARTSRACADMQTASSFAERLRARFPEALVTVAEPRGEVTIDVAANAWLSAAQALRDEFGFEQCVDVSGVDYLSYGSDEWDTDVSSEGF